MMMIEQLVELPPFLQRLVVQLLAKTTQLADYGALTFDWLILLLKCQVQDLVQTGLTVLLQHSDATRNTKRNNQQRTDWI